MSTHGAMRNLQCIPVMCLLGPHFLVAWNIHVLCNLPYTMCGIVRHAVAMRETATQGHGQVNILTTPYHKNALKQFFS